MTSTIHPLTGYSSFLGFQGLFGTTCIHKLLILANSLPYISHLITDAITYPPLVSHFSALTPPILIFRDGPIQSQEYDQIILVR